MTSTISLDVEEVGDGFVKLKARLTSNNTALNPTFRAADLTTIKKVYVSYNHSALTVPGKYQVKNLGGTLSLPDDPILRNFSGYMNGATWVPPAEVSIFLFSDDVYSSDPDGYGRPLIHFSNGSQVAFMVEVFGTDAMGNTTRITSNQKIAVPVGKPAPPVITASTPLSDRSFKLTVLNPTDNGGADIDNIFAYLSIPNTQVAGQSKYETRDLQSNNFEILTKNFDYLTEVTWNATNTAFDIVFEASLNFQNAQHGILPDTLYNVFLQFSNKGGGISNESNVFVAYPSDKPGQPTMTSLSPSDRSVTVNFTPPANSFFSYIKGIVVVDLNGTVTNYFKNTATGFVSVADMGAINNNTANIVMDPNLTYSFTVTGLTNNVSNDRKFYLVNSFGNGVLSSQITLIAQAAPTNVQSLTITPANAVNNVFANSLYPQTVKNYINPLLIDAVPIDVNFSDPASNWPTNRQANINYYYKTNIIEVDCSASAMSVAMKRFYGQGGTTPSIVPGDSTLNPTIVYNDLSNCISAIDNQYTGIANWLTYSDASKNTFIGNVRPIITISIGQAILALNEYYNIMAFKKYLLNDVSFNNINDYPGTSNSIVLTGLSSEIIYVPAGTFIKIQVSPIIEIPLTNTILTSPTPSTVQTVVKTNKLDAPTLSYTTASHQITATIKEPIFTYGYNIGTNYVLKLNGSNVQNIAVASGVPSNVFIANKTYTYTGITNGSSNSLDVTLSYPGTPQIDKSSNVSGIITNGVPSPVDLSGNVIFNPSTPTTASITFPAVTGLDGTTLSNPPYEFRLIDTNNLSDGMFDSITLSDPTQANITNASYTSVSLTGLTATCSSVPAGNGRQYYFIGRVLATASGTSVNSKWSRSQIFYVSGAPTTLAAPTVTQNNDTVNISWTPPNDDGYGSNNGLNISTYNLLTYDSTGTTLLSSSYVLQTRYTDTGILKVASPNNPSLPNLGLQNGTSYVFAVRAVSRNGLSLDGTKTASIPMQASVSFPANTAPIINNTNTNRTISVPLNLNGSTINQVAIMYTTTSVSGVTYNATVHADTFGAAVSGVTTAGSVRYVRNGTSQTINASVTHSGISGNLVVDIAPILSNLNASAATIKNAVAVITDSTSNMILTQI